MKPDLRVGNDGESPFVALSSVDRDPRQTATNRFPPSIALVNVVFDQPVTISGTPRLALTIGAHTRQATYSAGFNDNRAVAPFYYSLQASDFDGDGISVVANALALNGGTIRDAEGENAVLGLGSHAVANDATLRVADAAPSLRGDAGGAALPAEPAGERPAPGGDRRRRRADLQPLAGAPRRPLLERRHAHDLRHAPERDGGGPPTRWPPPTATATRRR